MDCFRGPSRRGLTALRLPAAVSGTEGRKYSRVGGAESGSVVGGAGLECRREPDAVRWVEGVAAGGIGSALTFGRLGWNTLLASLASLPSSLQWGQQSLTYRLP